MSTYVTMKGSLHNFNAGEVMGDFQELLANIGNYGVDIMRQKTTPHDFEQSLSKSIMWKTAFAAGGNEGNDSEIAVPDVENAVDIGSANDHAYFRENGTGPHRTPKDSDKFLEKIDRWCVFKFGFSRKTNSKRFWAIVYKIRKYGTSAVPFAINSVDEIREEARKLSINGVMKYWKRKNWTTI